MFGLRRRSTVSLRHSIGTRIYVAFTVLALIAGGLGTYGFYSLVKLGDIVADTYDRPLMAINFARSASFIFAEMQNEVLRLRLDPAANKASVQEQLKSLSSDFFDDLGVAEQRSLAEREREVARDIRRLTQLWITLPMLGDAANDGQSRDLSLQIAQRFDSLIELTADDSFLERRQSVLTVQQFEYFSIGATIAALLAAIGIAVYLTRRISHPLATAANVADRIGHGELETPFPDIGSDETGVLLKSLKLMQDRIRVMMEREQAQRQSAQGRLIDAVESSHEAIALIDPGGGIALSNAQFSRILPAVTQLLTVRREQMEDAGEIPSLNPTALLKSELLSDGAELQIGDHRWIRISRSPTREGGFFLSFTDISDLKEREDRYREAKIAAEAASVTKSRFLANMSHELRTPLNAIIGFSDLFAGEYFGPIGNAAYKEHAKEIQTSGWRLLGIIENVLDLSNSQSGNLELKLEPHDLRETVEEARRPLQRSCEEAGLSLTVDYGEAPLMIRGDAEKLRRILDNLSSNAIKFNRQGGRVSVVAQRNGGKIELVVSDTGIGIPESEIPIAFSAFGQIESTLNRRYDGTGLGLALASAYAEAHGGLIGLVSEVGSGTTVTVMFTEVDIVPEAMPVAVLEPPKARRGRARRVPVGMA